MRKPAVILLSVTLLTLVIAAQSYPPTFPRDGATKLMENERVAVWAVTWEKGHPTAMHRHPYDTVGIYLEPGGRIITGLNGAAGRPSMTQPYAVSFTVKGTTHIEEGTTDPPLKGVLIELKEDAPASAPEDASDIPPAFPREGAKQLSDNARVTVWDYKWTPGAMVPLHRHVKDAVVVWFEDGKLRSIPQSGSPEIVEAIKGKVRYSPRGTVHKEEAIEGPPHAVIVELK